MTVLTSEALLRRKQKALDLCHSGLTLSFLSYLGILLEVQDFKVHIIMLYLGLPYFITEYPKFSSI